MLKLRGPTFLPAPAPGKTNTRIPNFDRTNAYFCSDKSVAFAMGGGGVRSLRKPSAHSSRALQGGSPKGCALCRTVRILIICGILSFALGVLNFI